jgi:hypothetical protein
VFGLIDWRLVSICEDMDRQHSLDCRPASTEQVAFDLDNYWGNDYGLTGHVGDPSSALLHKTYVFKLVVLLINSCFSVFV